MGEERKMDALVTGASSGIGLAISKYLIDKGYEVYGIGRRFEEPVQSEKFHEVELDLNDVDRTIAWVKEFRKERDVKLLVNNAGVAYYGLFENVGPEKIDEMVRVNLAVPMMITSVLIDKIRENAGAIINISSHTAHEINTHGCAYGATKAGLSSFGRSLFSEYRKHGVKVVNIEPDITRTNLYRNADFTASGEYMASLTAEDVVGSVDYVLNQPDNVAINSISLTPQMKRIEKK